MDSTSLRLALKSSSRKVPREAWSSTPYQTNTRLCRVSFTDAEHSPSSGKMLSLASLQLLCSRSLIAQAPPCCCCSLVTLQPLIPQTPTLQPGGVKQTAFIWKISKGGPKGSSAPRRRQHSSFPPTFWAKVLCPFTFSNPTP